MPADRRIDERALLILNGYELEVLLEALAAIQEWVPNVETNFREPEHGQAWKTLTAKVAACVGPNGEVTSPGGSGSMH